MTSKDAVDTDVAKRRTQGESPLSSRDWIVLSGNSAEKRRNHSGNPPPNTLN